MYSTLRSSACDDRVGEVHLLELLRAAEAARTEDVDLHQLVADDVQPDQEHAVLDELGPHDLGDCEMHVGDLRLAQLSARVDVAAHVVAGANPPEGRVLALVAQRLAVHEEQPRVALGRRRQVLLGDDVAVAAHRIDHLVQVRHVLRPHQEHALAAGALERLQHDVSARAPWRRP